MIKRLVSTILAIIMIIGITPLYIVKTEAASDDLIWPCESAYYVTCMYYYKDGDKHSCSSLFGRDYTKGIDISGSGNVVAAESGTVELVENLGSSGFGKYVVIRHSSGYKTLYAHLASYSVSTGQSVSKGQKIGVMGSTGNSSGVHLHFEYSGGDPWKNVYNDKYYSKIVFEQNVRNNNSSYNSDKTIVNVIDKHYKKNGTYYYYDSSTGKPTLDVPQYNIDSRYPTPFKAHTVGMWTTSNGKTPVYSSINGAQDGNIYNGYNSGDDECTINEVYTNGWCKVSVPGITGDRYCKLSVFISDGYTPSNTSVSSKTITYTRSDGSTSYGYIGAGDSVTKVGSSGSYTQVIYPLTAGGYKCAWAKIDTSSANNNYPTPFKANTLLWWNTSDGKTPVYNDINGSQSGNIYNGYNDEDDECVIEEIYTNGWCKITVPGLSGYRYCQLSVFINAVSGYNIRSVTAPEWAQAYRRGDHGSPAGYVDAGDNIYIVAENDSMYQVVYPTSGYSYCRWIDKCALGHSYTTTVTRPTCTTQGYTTHTCSVCGNSYKDSYTSANGHNYSYIETKYPSTAATGTLTGSCANCTSTTTVTLPKLNTTDYSYSVTKNATCTESGTGRYAWKTTTYGNFYFEVSIPSTGHNYTTVTTEPTCTTDGYTVYTCNCGYSYTGDNVSSTGHDYSKVVTVPTCTERGYTTYTCHCGHSYIGDYVDASGHSYEAKITLSTCTNGGYTEFTCECGDHYIGDYTDKLEHSYIDGICTNCGEEDPNFTTEIDPNAPQIVVSNGIGIAGDTVTITVDLKNNPGFAGMNAYLTYSESLKLVEVKNHINLTFTSDATMVWDGVTDYTEDGQLLTLVFEVSDTAYEGDHFVKINFIEAYTAELNDVEFKTVEGCVTVIDFVYGDSDGDGIVNTKDIILIRHHVAAKNPVTGVSDVEVSVGADANGDGVVNTKDIILVRRYVAAKDPITGESSVVLGPNA